MPTIKLSTDLARIVGDTTGITKSGTSQTVPGLGTANVAAIRIMSGAIPTQNELEEAYDAWPRFTGSPSEILIELKPISASYWDVVANDVTWDLEPVVIAINSGTASWWIWTGNPFYNPTDRGTNPSSGGEIYLPSICGDISVVGGSGSMTLIDLTITAGNAYEIGPAIFPVPTSYTYT